MNKVIRVEKEMLPQIAEIQKRVYAHFLDNEPWTQQTALAFMEYSYNLQPDLFFVLLHDDQIAGYIIGCIKPWSDGNHLMCEELVIDFPHQGKGLAQFLSIRIVEEALKKYNVTAVEAQTYENEAGSPMKMYKQVGFKQQHYFLIKADAKKLLENLSVYQ